MQPDPVVLDVAATGVALVFVIGAAQKLRDVQDFEIAVEAYELVPDWLLAPVAFAIPLAELAAGMLLLAPATRPAGALLGLVLLLVVTGAVVVNLLRGRTDVGCGCGGLEDEQTLSWALVARNAVLALVIAAAAGAAAAPRSLIWLDYLTVAAGALCAYGIYALASQLIANQPRLARLRTAR